VDDLAEACLFIMRHYDPYPEACLILQKNIVDHLNIGSGIDQTGDQEGYLLTRGVKKKIFSPRGA
jgi:hypothetical protein